MNKNDILITILKKRMPEFSKKEIKDFVSYLDYDKKIRNLEENFKKVDKKFSEVNCNNGFESVKNDILNIFNPKLNLSESGSNTNEKRFC